MKIDVDIIKNMTLEDIQKLLDKDISQEKFETTKEILLKEANMKNDILDLVNKYGIENVPNMLDFLIEEMKLYFQLINEFKNSPMQVNKKCCCECKENA